MFNDSMLSVALIRKQNFEQQAGPINRIGGKVEKSDVLAREPAVKQN